MSFETIFQIIVVVFSIVLHEVAHGYMANYLGDPTARLQGRLTLNPISHLDPVGSILLPGFLALTHSPFFFGWAKPVPYNPYNIRVKNGELYVALAGPATNLLLAIIFGVLIRVALTAGIDVQIMSLMTMIVGVNTMLAIFNLIPIPPMDGSKILYGLLPLSLARPYDDVRSRMETNPLIGFGIVLIFLMVFGSSFGILVTAIMHLIAGV